MGINNNNSVIKRIGLLIGATSNKFIITNSIIQHKDKNIATRSLANRPGLPNNLQIITTEI